jgi:23S rRNA (adenine2503-C2)-methyltransferase
MIRKLADDDVKFNLAISLHTANDYKRDELMPINKSIPLLDLKEAIKYFYDKTGIRVTYEYILFKEINDSIADAKELIKFCKITPCKVNLIEYNTVDNMPFEKSTNRKTEEFISFLTEKRVVVNLRKSKGKDINAACGQLVNKLK